MKAPRSTAVVQQQAPHHGRETRKRLLDCAIEAFAASGFHETTVAAICRTAGANIAAVNYHFRNKQNLYVQAWRTAFRRSLAEHPLDGGVADDAPAAARLRGRIEALISRIADPALHDFSFIRHERTRPTPLLAEILRDCIEPVRSGMTAAIGELLGPAADPARIALCRTSVMGQCLHLVKRHRRSPPPSWPEADEDLSLTERTEHIVRFSLAGIRDVRKRHRRERERADAR